MSFKVCICAMLIMNFNYSVTCSHVYNKECMKRFDLNKFLNRSLFVCAVLHVGMLETESSTAHSQLIFSWDIWEPEENTHVRTNSHAHTHTHTHARTHTHEHTHHKHALTQTHADHTLCRHKHAHTQRPAD